MSAILELMGVDLTQTPWQEAEVLLEEAVRRRRIDPASLDPLSTYNLLQETALAARDPSQQAALDAASVFLLDSALNGRQLAHLVAGQDSLSPVLEYLQFLVENDDLPSVQKYLEALPEPLLWRIYATQIYDSLMSVSFARALTDAHVAAARIHLRQSGGSQVLDIGAGTGLVAEALTAEGISVVAVEPNPAMAERLRKRLALSVDVKIHQDFFEKVNLAGQQFDLVNLRNVLYLIDQPEKFMQKVFSHLKPGGKVLISGPMPNGEAMLPLLDRDTFAELSRTGRKEEIWRLALMGPINKRLLKSSYVHDADVVVAMLQRVGFEVGDGDVDTRFYHGSTYLIQATRPNSSAKIIPGGPAAREESPVASDRSLEAGVRLPDDGYNLDEPANNNDHYVDLDESDEQRTTSHDRRTTPWHLRGAQTGVAGRTFMTRTGTMLRVLGR